MTAQADIKTGQRCLIEFVLAPLLRANAESMRKRQNDFSWNKHHICFGTFFIIYLFVKEFKRLKEYIKNKNFIAFTMFFLRIFGFLLLLIVGVTALDFISLLIIDLS